MPTMAERRKQGDRQRKKMLTFIKKFIRKNQYAPTFDEIREAVGPDSTSAVRYHLKKLEEQGVIKLTPRTSRSIVVVED